MRRLGFLVIVGVFFWTPMPAAGQEKKKEAAKGASAEKTDISAEVRLMNTAQYEAPPKEFRPGKVTPRQLDARATKKTASGFTIQLPSKAPIPTPTIYKGKLYVSGGFHSREYYCFDAVTGKLEWAVDLDDDGPTSAVCEDDKCVFNTESCTIFALDAKTGKQHWSKFLGDPLTSTPTIARGRVFTSYPAAGGGFQGNAMPFNGPQMAGFTTTKDKDAKGKQKPPGSPVPGPLVQPTPQPVAPAQDPADQAKKPAGDAKSPDDAGRFGKQQQQAQLRPKATHVLVCIDLKSGNILWQRWIDSDVMSAPVAVEKDVYATSFAGTVYRFSQDKGDILSAQRSRATSAPVVVGPNVYMTRRADSGKDGKVEEQIASLNRLTEQAQFASQARSAPYINPQIQAKSDLDKEGKALDKGNGFGGGAPATANPNAAYMNVGQGNVSTMQSFQGSRILNFQNANYNCMGNEVVSTNPASGQVNWSLKLDGNLEKLGGFLASPPAAAGGKIFLATFQGEVLQLDPAKGTIITRYKVGSPVRSQPAIDAGRIYVGTQDGKVVCIDTGNPQFTGWTTWGANSAHTNTVEKK